MLVSHLAFHHDGVFSAQEERENVLRLCQTSTCTFIENSPTHLVFDAGSFKMRWELHTEYSALLPCGRCARASRSGRTKPHWMPFSLTGFRAFPAS